MPVPTDITTLDLTAANNSPSGSEGASAGDDHIRQIYAFIASLRNGPTALALGTTAACSLAFTSDPNTGLYSPGADQVGVVAGASVWKNNAGVWQNPSNTQTSFRALSSTALTASGTFTTYTSEDYDQGSAFNSTTGVFTAPVAGVYLFTAKVGITADPGAAVIVNIVTNIQALTAIRPVTNGTGAATSSHSMSVLARLAAAETVYMNCTIATAAATVTVPHFAGHFLG